MTDRAESSPADARSGPASGRRAMWVGLLALPVALALVLSFRHSVAALVAISVPPIVIWLLLYRFRSRGVTYACSVAVLLLAVIFTVGVVGETRTVPSAMTGMGHSSSRPGLDAYTIDVACDASQDGHLSALLRKGDWDRIGGDDWSDGNPQDLELTYQTQSILGTWSLPPVADAIDSRLVISDQDQDLRGGIVGRVMLALTLALGALPLIYLLSRDGMELLGARRRR